MTYCSNCGIIIEDFDCPVCGWKNFRPEKPAQKAQPQKAESHPCPGKSSLLVSGGVGAVLVAVSSLLLGLVPVLNSVYGSGPMEFATDELFYILILATVLFMVGSIIMAVGFYGFYKLYDANSGIVAQVFIIIGAITLMVFTLIAANHDTSTTYYCGHYHYYSDNTIDWSIWVGHAFTGVTAILGGICLMLVRRKTGARELSMAAGILCIVSGSLLIGIMGLVGVGWIFLSVSFLVCAALFFLAKSAPASHS